MVVINDNPHEHDDGDELCPRCGFIDRLGDFLDETGGLIEHMHSALWALHRLRAESTADYIDEIDNVGEAAPALVALGEIVVRLQHTLRG